MTDVQIFPAPPAADDSLVECALKVLKCPDPGTKADFTNETVKLWREGAIKRVRPAVWQHLHAPDRPARSDDKVRVCAPGETPRRGKGGTLASRQALLHSAVHIENWAVDLAWDMVARFGLQPEQYDMPRQFFDDFVTIAEDECRHFTALAKRLEETGSYYGAFAVHDGLWESAANTAHSLPARLAVEHCVHEARGLDVLPSTIAKFARNGDSQSAALLRDVIYPEEVSHCAAGIRWFRYLYDVAHGKRQPLDPADSHVASQSPPIVRSPPPLPSAGSFPSAAADPVTVPLTCLHINAGEATGGAQVVAHAAEGSRDGGGADDGDVQSSIHNDGDHGDDDSGGDGGVPLPEGAPSWVLDARKYSAVEDWFHSLVRAHFWGGLKPPFNEEARVKAGFGPEWYLPLAVQPHQLLQQ